MTLNWDTKDEKPITKSAELKSNFKYEHDREDCISCGACAAINPEKWKMSAEDGKSDCTVEYYNEDVNDMEMETAESCPVNVIHIIDLKQNKKLI